MLRRARFSGRVLSLASGVLPEFGPEQTAAAAAEAGWDAVGIWVEPAAWSVATTRAVRAVGLPVLDVEVVWIKPGPPDPDHARVLEIGAALGAANVLVVSSDPDRQATVEKLALLAAQARTLGVRVALEFAAFTEVRTLEDALDVLTRPELAEVSLLIDPLHFARTGGQPEVLAGIARGRFAYAQYCDALAHGPHPEDRDAILQEAIDLRLLPGTGELPLDALLAVLPAGLPLSVEIRSKALREAYGDAAARALAVMEAM
jgi:sugar phosphate isomerase/epimerase